tara:strand:+ start:3948 stop:5660 length:1713 start_codon:yes stop_codon:yes gene_type:complete
MKVNSLRKKREFVTPDLIFEWEKVKPYYIDLKERKISTVADLEIWLKDRSELSAVLEEEFAWRYIRMNIDTENDEYQKEFQFFVQNINPKIAPYENELNKKLVDCEQSKSLKGSAYKILLRGVKKELKLFREENIPLFTKLEEESQKFGAITAKMTIEIDGKELTLQEAAKFLKSTDRAKREQVFNLMNERRLKDTAALDDLFNELIRTRQKVSDNAGFENYRDYMFQAMGRFDYTSKDCYQFHEAIKKKVVPLSNEVELKRKELLQLDDLRPWDLSVDISGKAPLQPFETADELVSKTIQCFNQIDPFFGECIEEMHNNKHLDLSSKKGKAPGGFNYPLYESGYPFIYMNAVGTPRDVTTMVHEGGHAIHSILSHHLELVDFKNLSSEIAELASMSMELISMDYWSIFYPNPDDLKRAKRDQLLDILNTLPWVATIDKFQHWIYTNKTHSVEERSEFWLSLLDEFGSSVVNWSGFEKTRKNQWQKQLHLFEVPFYYIEYGMAQLGAIAIWKNFREDPKKTIEDYKAALSLGYTKTIPEIYQAAGIQFDFSEKYVDELIQFVHQEILKTF